MAKEFQCLVEVTGLYISSQLNIALTVCNWCVVSDAHKPSNPAGSLLWIVCRCCAMYLSKSKCDKGSSVCSSLSPGADIISSRSAVNHQQLFGLSCSQCQMQSPTCVCQNVAPATGCHIFSMPVAQTPSSLTSCACHDPYQVVAAAGLTTGKARLALWDLT